MRPQTTCSRRSMLGGAVAAGASPWLARNPAWAADGLDPRTANIVKSTLGIDTHNHIDVPMSADEVAPADRDLAGQMTRSGLSAICMTFAVDYVPLVRVGQPYDRFQTALSHMDDLLARNGMSRSLSLTDLRTAHAQGRPTVVQAVEGAHFLEGHVERLDKAYGRGLRHLGLLHDSDAKPALGDVYTNPPRFGGLAPLGVEVIKACNRLGLLVDLAHASAKTTRDALKVATKPVIISHTGLDTQLGRSPGLAQMMRARLIGKDQARAVAEAGGVIGVWTHLADTPMDYARNVRALVDVIGVDHVAIGTDTKLTPGMPHGPAPSQAPGQGMPGGPPPGDHDRGPPPGGGGKPGGAQTGERTNAAWPHQKAGFYYLVVDALLKTGFSADEIGRIGGGNFCRVFGAATGEGSA